MNNKEYVVFSQRLAGHLMKEGFVLKRIEVTKQDKSKRNVFIFNESESLLQAVYKYK